MNLFSGTISHLKMHLHILQQNKKSFHKILQMSIHQTIKLRMLALKLSLDDALGDSIKTNRTDNRHLQFHHQAANPSYCKERFCFL